MLRLLLVVLFNGVLGQIQLQGPCNVTSNQVVTDVKHFKMLGLWYQRERIPNPKEVGECSINIFSVYTLFTGTVSHLEQVGDDVRVWEGYIYRDYSVPYKFIVTYYGTETEKYDTYVLATNYNDYALLYSCVTSGNTRYVNAWTLSRRSDYVLDSEAAKDLLEALDRNPDIQDLSRWKIVNHTNCNNQKLRSMFSQQALGVPGTFDGADAVSVKDSS